MRIYLAIGLALLLVQNSFADIVAHDSASNAAYQDGWDNGDNGGFGMGSWNLSFDGNAGALNPIYNGDPHFIDGVGVGPLGNNQLGGPAFGLTTDNSTGSSATASRTFHTPVTVGDTFRISIDGSALEGDPRIGNFLQLIGEDGVARYTLSTSLGSNNEQWISGGRSTGFDAADAFNLRFTLTGLNTFSLSLSSLDNSSGFIDFSNTLSGTDGQAITGLRIGTSGTGSSPEGARELFFNGISLTSAVPEPSTAIIGFAILFGGLVPRRRA